MRKIITQILFFSFVFMGIFAFTRFLMLVNLTSESQNSFMVYMYGLAHDMRTFSSAFLPLFLCGFLTYFAFIFKNKKIKFMGGGNY